MFEKVKDIIEEIRPAIRSDGGDIELIGVEEGTVTVHLSGMCESCMASEYTLKGAVERVLKARLPEVKEVIAV